MATQDLVQNLKHSRELYKIPWRTKADADSAGVTLTYRGGDGRYYKNAAPSRSGGKLIGRPLLRQRQLSVEGWDLEFWGFGKHL